MRFVVLFIFCLLKLSASTANQILSVSYFNESQIRFKVPQMPNFIKSPNSENIEKGYMLFYEKKLFDISSFLSFYAGGNIGKYHKDGDSLYSGSLSLASRVWLLHLVVIHPYVEFSLFGPTVLSKNQIKDVDLKSNFLFQNYISLGTELGRGSGLNLELKAVKFFRANLVKSESDGVKVPLLLSLGYLF
jgi:hypothetical protein